MNSHTKVKSRFSELNNSKWLLYVIRSITFGRRREVADRIVTRLKGIILVNRASPASNEQPRNHCSLIRKQFLGHHFTLVPIIRFQIRSVFVFRSLHYFLEGVRASVRPSFGLIGIQLGINTRTKAFA